MEPGIHFYAEDKLEVLEDAKDDNHIDPDMRSIAEACLALGVDEGSPTRKIQYDMAEPSSPLISRKVNTSFQLPTKDAITTFYGKKGPKVYFYARGTYNKSYPHKATLLGEGTDFFLVNWEHRRDTWNKIWKTEYYMERLEQYSDKGGRSLRSKSLRKKSLLSIAKLYSMEQVFEAVLDCQTVGDQSDAAGLEMAAQVVQEQNKEKNTLGFNYSFLRNLSLLMDHAPRVKEKESTK